MNSLPSRSLADPAIVFEDLDGDSLTFPEYVEDAEPVLIDQGIAVTLSTAPESFAGLILTVSVTAMSSSQIFLVRDVGAGAGQIGFQDGIVTYEGVAIGGGHGR